MSSIPPGPPDDYDPGPLPEDHEARADRIADELMASLPIARYYDDVHVADGALADALSHIRAREDAQEITVVEAADERVELLERHLAECQRIRRLYFGTGNG